MFERPPREGRRTRLSIAPPGATLFRLLTTVCARVWALPSLSSNRGYRPWPLRGPTGSNGLHLVGNHVNARQPAMLRAAVDTKQMPANTSAIQRNASGNRQQSREKLICSVPSAAPKR